MDISARLTRIANALSEGTSKTAAPVPPDETIVGKNVRISWGESYHGGWLKIQELPQKPLKRHLDAATYDSDFAKYIRPHFKTMQGHDAVRTSFVWLFSPKEIAKAAKFSKSMDYGRALNALKSSVQSAIQKAEKSVRDALKKGPVLTYDKKPVTKQVLSKLFNRISQQANQSLRTDTTHYLQVEPANYEPITIKGIGIVGTFEWTEFQFSPTHDPTANPMEGMRSFYKSSSPTKARKLYKIIKPDPKKFEQMSEKDFLEVLKKNKIPAKYVPTVWR